MWPQTLLHIGFCTFPPKIRSENVEKRLRFCLDLLMYLFYHVLPSEAFAWDVLIIQYICISPRETWFASKTQKRSAKPVHEEKKKLMAAIYNALVKIQLFPKSIMSRNAHHTYNAQWEFIRFPSSTNVFATHGRPISNRLFWISCFPSMVMQSWMHNSIRQPAWAHCRVKQRDFSQLLWSWLATHLRKC